MRVRVCLVLLFALYAMPASALPVLSIQPSVPSVTVGSNVTIDILISQAVDVYAFEFDFGFDPALFSALDISEGSFLASGGSTFYVPGTIDNTAGTISFTGNTLIGGIPGVSGAGLLARVTLGALAPGTSLLSLFNVTLLDSQLADIPSVIQNGSVTAAVASVPTPSTLLLLLPGLLGLGLARARKRAG